MDVVQNEFPMPANAVRPAPPAAPAPSVSATNLAYAFRTFAGQESFVLDPDLKLALEDQCAAAEGSHWREQWPKWLNEMVNEGLRQMLGR
jgi:hypothetical protein